MRVAVLGAGILGACVALELAQRGCAVDLYDRAGLLITQASLHNEGKIHLGFVYAKDSSRRTLRTIMRGSLSFASLLRRWISPPLDVHLSSPFLYGIPRDTMMSPDAIDAHFQAVQEAYDEMRDGVAHDYLGSSPRRLFEPLGAAELHRIFQEGQVVAGYRTVERAVPPWRVAGLFRQAVARETRIQFLGGTEVSRVRPDGRRQLCVVSAADGRESTRSYDHVVNALWGGRLGIDRTMGLLPSRPWLMRFKLAITFTPPYPIVSLPSVTFVLGPFGDIVNFGDSRIYLSWYPRCMVGASSAVDPPDLLGAISEVARRAILDESLKALTALCPPLRQVGRLTLADVDIGGGVIFAWGVTDIEDPESELHRRDEIGVVSHGGYHTVNTGKYCMAPLLALTVCDGIAPMSSGARRGAPRGWTRARPPSGE